MSPIVIAGDVAIPRGLLSEGALAADREALSVRNPARVQAERLGDRRAWRFPERLSLLREEADVVRYPVVRRDVWAPRAKSTGADIVDTRPTFIPSPLSFQGELFPYQSRALDALLAAPYGGIVGPPGCGKSEMIAAITGRVGVPTLVVSGQVDLANDLAARLHARLGVTVGRIGAGVLDVQRITVATIQRLDPTATERIASSFGCLIVDEGHHAAAPSYLALSSSLAVRHRYWLTATPRTDGLQPFVAWTIGATRATITRRELEAAGRSTSPRLVQVPTSFRCRYESREDWHALLDAVVTDDERNTLIVSEVAKRCGPRVLGAVITGRVEHAKLLAEMFTAAGLRSVALTGEMIKADRAKTIAAARLGGVDVLVATQLFDEGIDIPNLAVVALVFPARAEGRITQRVGRALRVHEGKPAPVVLDFVDADVGPLAWQAKARERIFQDAFGASSREVAA